MSASQRSMSALALLLGLLIATAIPAAGQVSSSYPPDYGIMPTVYYWWSLTIINLTTHNLQVVGTSIDTTTCESRPFHGNVLDGGDAFPLPPFRTVTWKSASSIFMFCPSPQLSGYKDFLPEGMDGKWTVRLNFFEDSGWEVQQVFLSPARGFKTPDGWPFPNPNGWIYDDEYYNMSCSFPDDNRKYNVMTLSGTDLVATLYTPVINKVKPEPTAMITLVLRERWPHTQHGSDYEDSLIAPCLTFKYVEQY